MDTLGLFRNPSLLALVVIPMLILAWVWRPTRATLSLPFDHGRQSHGAHWRIALQLAESVPALLLAVVLAILAGPQSWGAPRTQRALTNIQFCVDVSGSMSAGFGSGERYDASMAAINEFIDKRQGDAFGLTFFGNNVLHWVPLTTDVSAFRCAPPFMRPRNLPGWFGGTEIAKALLACRKLLLEREEGDRMIVLVSDGFSSDLGGGNEELVARQLAQDGIAVYTVHVAEGAIPSEIVRLASLTGGEAFKSEDEAGLARVFEHIDRMQVTRLETVQPQASDDLRPWCLAGLLLVGLGLLCALGLRATPW